MDFSLGYTKEQEEFAKEVRGWLDSNVPEDLVSPRDTRKMSYEQWQKRRELGRKLGEKGWLWPEQPREYGGGSLDADHSFVLRQELAERYLGLPPYSNFGELAVPAILAGGSEEQKKCFLPPILKGEAVTWQLLTEPEAGTDQGNQQTNAFRSVREKDYFIVNGQKIFVGGLYPPPDQFLLLSRSDLEAPKYQNLAMFFTPANLLGVTIQPLDIFPLGRLGRVCGPAVDDTGGVKYSVFFDDVRIHESCLLGGERDGWRVANAALTVGHGDSGLVTRNFLLEKFLTQCKSNPNMVKRLDENPQLLDSVVDIYIGAQIERLFSMRNHWLAQSGRRVPYTGMQLLVYSKMSGTGMITDMAEVLGPYAFIDDAEWGLDEGIFEVGQRCGVCLAPGGPPEGQKIVMSRALGIGR
ncbi:acyl-CoA dehydrogenase family protein [Chloroflexota bacterium]